LIGLILALILAFRYHPFLGRYLEKWIHQPAALTIVSFVIVLAVILLLFKLIGLAARAAMSAVSMGWFDRLAGAAFGFVKAVLLVAVLFALLIACTDKPSKPVAQSRLAPRAIAVSNVIARFFPEDVRERYLDNEERMMKRLRGETPEGKEELKRPESAPQQKVPGKTEPGKVAPAGKTTRRKASQTV
jgi:membrane protein required for colicin V production